MEMSILYVFLMNGEYPGNYNVPETIFHASQ